MAKISYFINKMNIKQKVTSYLVAGLVLVGTGSLLTLTYPAAAKCGGVDTSIINCDQKNTKDGGLEDNGVWGLLLIVLNIMTAGVGIVAVGGIVYGSILYASAGGSTDQVKKAIGIIRNVVIGLIAFLGMYAFLNFLIPGGIFT